MQDESKRKRESSTDSSSSSFSIVQKKAKEDSASLANISESSVFSTPNLAMATAHKPVGADIPEIVIDHNSSNHSGGMDSLASTSSSPAVSSANKVSLEQRAVIVKDLSAQFITQHPDPAEAQAFISNLLSYNTDKFEASVNSSVHNSVQHAVDARMSVFESRIRQDVFSAVKHDMDVEYDDVRRELSDLKIKYNNLEEKFDCVDAKLHSIDKKSVENDQYARRYTIRIRGILEQQGEDLKGIVIYILFHQLRINIAESDIEIIHRAGFRQPMKNRVILCRFKDRGLKYAIMLQRKCLKGTGITFEEDLCKEYENILYELKDHPKVDRVWSWNGKVMAEDIYGGKHTLRYGTDWVSFFHNIETLRQRNARAPPNTQASDARRNASHPSYQQPPPPPPPISQIPLPATSPPPPPPPMSTAAPSSSTSAISSSATGTSSASLSINNTTATHSTATVSSTKPAVTSQSIQMNPSNSQSTLTTQSAAPPQGSHQSQVSASLTSTVTYSGAAAAPLRHTAPPLHIPLKDISKMLNFNSGAYRQPPTPSRFPGSPNITRSPRAASTPFISLPSSPLTKGPRSKVSTPKAQRKENQPPISPSISSYFTRP